FRSALSLAHSKGDVSRVEFARKRTEAVQPRLGTLTIVIASPEPGLVVRRDGTPVESPAWGLAMPVDAGVHHIEASSPGKQAFSGSVTSKDGLATTFKLEPLASSPNQAMPTAPPPADRNSDTPKPEARKLKTLGVIGMGVGAVVLGAGGFFAIRALSL